MIFRRRFNNSIHQRFLIVALLPLVLITSLLSIYTIDARRSDLSVSLNQSGEMASDYLSTISDFALYSRNSDMLLNIALSATNLPDIASVGYLDKQHQLVLNTKGFPLLAQSIAVSFQTITGPDNQLYFKKPIYLSGIEFNDYYEEIDSQVPHSELVGWVIVGVDQSGLLAKERNIITTTLWLALTGFVIATILTYLLSIKLIAPIKKLTSTIKTMASGHLNVRAEIDSQDELSILANGINQLAESVTEGRVNLEDRIRVATRKLKETLADLKRKNQELEAARLEAEKANLAKNDFLARMSHELRTPITSIQGFARLLEAARLSETDVHHCQIIDQAALHLLTLIDDILAFSKLQSNTVELAQQPINLAECSEQVTALFGPQAQHKGLDLIVDYAPDLPLHRIGDSVRIQQILSNLIANAIKFCNEGRIYIQLKSDQQSGVIIEIQDTGIGIPEDAQDQLFNAFAQADTSISRLYGGTGLGLSIVKNLVDLMGGQITVKSTVGKGSTFIINLPLPLAEHQPDWQIVERKVVIGACHEHTTQAVVHALERFNLNDIVVTDKENLITAVAGLSSEDRVILCLPTAHQEQFNVTEFILELRAATPAKLIVTATQFNYYQLFNAKQRAELFPITFLALPPPLSELQRALSEEPSASPALAASLPNTQLLDGVNILIAEDNQFTRLLLDTLLSRLGAYCTLTSNGNEALAACQHDRFDIFLVDVHMPLKNGIETIRTLRQSSNHNANLPTLAITADILQQEEDALFKAGANGLLIKPLDEDALLKAICQQLNISPPLEPTPATTASGDITTELFRQEVHSLLNSASSSLETDDILQLRESIHQLLGFAGIFKLSTLEQLVRTLHEMVKTNRLEQVPALIGEIGTEVDNTEI